jgi:prefoldin subunit 5
MPAKDGESMYGHVVHEMAESKKALDERIDAVEQRLAEMDREYDRQIEYLKKRIEELVDSK